LSYAATRGDAQGDGEQWGLRALASLKRCPEEDGEEKVNAE